MLQKYLILWLVLLSLVAAVWPGSIADPFLLSKPWLGVMVAMTMLCVGSLLPQDEVRDVSRRWPLSGATCDATAVQVLDGCTRSCTRAARAGCRTRQLRWRSIRMSSSSTCFAPPPPMACANAMVAAA